jgi:hypothetical protein
VLIIALALAAVAMTHTVVVLIRWLERRRDRYEKGPFPRSR